MSLLRPIDRTLAICCSRLPSTSLLFGAYCSASGLKYLSCTTAAKLAYRRRSKISTSVLVHLNSSGLDTQEDFFLFPDERPAGWSFL
jgi:hypothetical protein